MAKGSIQRSTWESALRELRESPAPESDAKTSSELAELWGLSQSQASKHAKRLVAAGKAKHTKKPIRRSDGGLIWSPAYLLV